MSSHACAANVLADSDDNRAQVWGTLDDGCARRKLEGRATHRAIDSGEELTVDYATFSDYPDKLQL